MDTIFINNLIIRGHLGVSQKEKIRMQRFRISVTILIDTKKACVTDSLENTFDYYPLKNNITRIIQLSSKNLIESLAEKIAQLILLNPRAFMTKVTVEKVDLWPPAIAGVTVERKNQGYSPE